MLYMPFHKNVHNTYVPTGYHFCVENRHEIPTKLQESTLH